MTIVRRLAGLGIWCSILVPQLASAEVVRVEIRERGAFADGCAFGRSGPYERIAGRLHFEVSPEDALNAGITDLKLAPRNAAGRVEFWSDFFLLKPVDPARGNRRLLYDVNNRGNKLALWTFNEARGNNPSTPADAGNGFLLREGWSVLWCGWSGDVMPGDDRLLAGLPVARENGKTITGKIHAEICRDEPVGSSPLYWTPWALSVVYLPVSLDTRRAQLTMRPKRSEPAVEIPPDQWAFARLEGDKPEPDSGSIWVKGGLRPGWLYELVYEGQDPRVSGLGFAAVRDCASFFRYEKADRHDTANPLAGAVERAYIFGISQSGRFVNHLVYDGFNTDERQRIVFDGALSHVSGSGRGLFNHRFGMATLCATHHENLLTPSELFPFTTVPQTDPVTGRSGDILARARQRGHVPKIIFTQTSTEYWTRGASLLHTDVAGTKDVDLDPNARLYVVAGAQHLGGGPTDRGLYQNPRNPLDVNDDGDVFEGNVDWDRIRSGFEQLRQQHVKVRLVPGDPFDALARIANETSGIDLVVVAGDQDPELMARAWLFLPRMIHDDTLVLSQAADAQGRLADFVQLTRQQVEELAGLRGRRRRLAA